MRRSFKNLEDPKLHSDRPPGSEPNPGPENRMADCGRGCSLRPGRACRSIFASGSRGSPGVLQPVLLALSPRLDRPVGAGPSCRAALRRTGQQHLQRGGGGGGGGRPGAPLGGGGRRPARGALADWSRRGLCHVGGSGAFCTLAAAAESVRAASCFLASSGSRR